MTIEVRLRHRQGDFVLDVAFAGPSPGVTALFGRSGAGKSTTVQAVAGLLRPDEGLIRVDGTTFLDTAAGIRLPPERRRVGIVFQDARLFPHMSVEANLLYGWRRAPRAERRIEPGPVVELLGIGHLMRRRPHGLSGGERQRVALGRALLAQPRLLLMDEPLASLDGPRKAEILPYLDRLRAELRLPVVYVSHAAEEVARLADRVVVLADGRVAAEGPVSEVLGLLAPGLAEGPEDQGSVLEGRVRGHDDAWRLTEVETPAGPIVVPRVALPEGAAVRVRVRARDVIVAAERPEATSVQNALPAVVRSVAADPDGPFATVLLDAGGSDLAARVTRRSADRLGLAPGARVWALVKAASLSPG
jgi:molybdate transport system ATP-binding protein